MPVGPYYISETADFAPLREGDGNYCCRLRGSAFPVTKGAGMSNTVRYVGDPFVDAGISVLEHRIEKEHNCFSRADLEAQAEWLVLEYSSKAWAGYLTVHFPNSGWCNATMSSANKAEFHRTVLQGFDLPGLGRACSYCGRMAQDLADRSKIPFLTSATSMVAGPGGVPGFPVCAYCLYAVQFYPLATLKVEGKPLFWWSADSRWLYYLTGEFLDEVFRVLAGSSDKFPNLRWPSTRLLHAATRVLNRALGADELRLADIVGCHVTNFGSGPSYEEIRLPQSLLAFLAEARSFVAYTAVVQSNWEGDVRQKPSKKSLSKVEIAEWGRRNFFYEDLGRLLRSADDRSAATEVARKYFVSLRAPAENRSFQLSRLFLERMAEMTKERLDAIERLATRVAESSSWKDSVDRLFRAKNVIRVLVDIQDRLLRAKEGSLVTADVYQAFDIVSWDDASYRDSGLVRDLMLLKILELRGEAAIPDIDQEVA